MPARGLGAIDFVWVLFMLGHVSTIMPLVNELGATHFTRVLTLVSMIANEMCFDGALVKESDTVITKIILLIQFPKKKIIFKKIEFILHFEYWQQNLKIVPSWQPYIKIPMRTFI